MCVCGCPQEQRRGGKVSQVEEESEGWYRLRTVARDWSSDEDEPQTQVCWVSRYIGSDLSNGCSTEIFQEKEER